MRAGSIYAFGFGGFGGMATGELKNELVPLEVPALTSLSVQHISVGLWHTLIISDTGKLYSVGRGRYGALGLGDDADIILSTPTLVDRFGEGTRIKDAAAGRFHSLCVTDDGRIYSFGFGHGCGNSANELIAEPTPITSMLTYRVKSVSAGEHHSACVTEDGKLFTWGMTHRVPLEVTANGLSQEAVAKVSCGNKHGMIITQSGKLFGYGENKHNQINDQATFIEDSAPIQLHPDIEWKDVYAGLYHTIAQDVNNNVYLWGDICPGGNEPCYRVSFHKVNTDSIDVKSIFSGFSSFGILTESGQVYMWGYNEHGNLGMNHTRNISKPTRVDELQSVRVDKVFAGAYNVFCMLPTGTSFINLLNEAYNSDVIIKSGNERYPVHKCILAVRSMTLKNLLEECDTELNVTSIIPSSILLPILELIYTNITTHVRGDYKLFQETTQQLQITNVSVFNGTASGDTKNYEADMIKLWNNPTEYYSDVCFQLDDSEELVHAHKCILSTKSEFFKAMFSTGMLESHERTVKFNDARLSVFTELLKYMYSFQISDIGPEIAVELLELSIRINWNRLKTTAERVILKHIDMNNALQMLDVAEVCGSTSIKNATILTIASNISDFDLSSLDEEIVKEINSAHEKIINAKVNASKMAAHERNWLKGQETEISGKDKQRLVGISSQGDQQRVNSILRNNCLIQ